MDDFFKSLSLVEKIGMALFIFVVPFAIGKILHRAVNQDRLNYYVSGCFDTYIDQLDDDDERPDPKEMVSFCKEKYEMHNPENK